LGNLDVFRDWADAEDCVDAVWRMMNQEDYRGDWTKRPEGGILILPPRTLNLHEHIREYVVSTGETHTVREFVERAFKAAGITGYWHGEGLHERYHYRKEGGDILLPRTPLVSINAAYYRPAEVDKLLGNLTLIKNELGWTPKTTFGGLVEKMVKRDLELIGY